MNRQNAVRDVESLLHWIARQKNLDSSRVAIAGRSYGGFLALASVATFPSRLQAAISVSGIAHFPSFLESTAAYRRESRRVEYGDERDAAMAAYLNAISPLRLAHRINSPIMLCHGRRDPRVPWQQSQNLFDTLQVYGKSIWFLGFENEGHVIREEQNQLHYMEALCAFLTRKGLIDPLPSIPSR